MQFTPFTYEEWQLLYTQHGIKPTDKCVSCGLPASQHRVPKRQFGVPLPGCKGCFQPTKP